MLRIEESEFSYCLTLWTIEISDTRRHRQHRLTGWTLDRHLFLTKNRRQQLPRVAEQEGCSRENRSAPALKTGGCSEAAE